MSHASLGPAALAVPHELMSMAVALGLEAEAAVATGAAVPTRFFPLQMYQPLTGSTWQDELRLQLVQKLPLKLPSDVPNSVQQR